MAWTPLQFWRDGEQLTTEKFNNRIEGNIQWLYSKNIQSVIIRNGVSDPSAGTGLNWVAISQSVLYVDITTLGNDLLINFLAGISNTGVQGKTLLDIYVLPKNRDPFFLSSLTATPLATGLWSHQLGSSLTTKRSFTFLWTNVPANGYRLVPYWRAITGTNSLNLTNTITQFVVQEYGAWTKI